jgi:predicted nucleic acid-binding Zn ribbon protein
MSEAETKICPLCAETIKAAAKVCPFCGRMLPLSNKEKWRKGMEAWLLLLAFAVIVFGGLFWLQWIFRPGKPFEPYREKLVVVDAQMHFSSTVVGNCISTIGFIRNDSSLAWRNVQIEVQYFDREGRLTDTMSDSFRGQRLPAGKTHAFRIRSAADKPASAYVSQKVSVRAASDASTFP